MLIIDLYLFLVDYNINIIFRENNNINIIVFSLTLVGFDILLYLVGEDLLLVWIGFDILLYLVGENELISPIELNYFALILFNFLRDELNETNFPKAQARNFSPIPRLELKALQSQLANSKSQEFVYFTLANL